MIGQEPVMTIHITHQSTHSITTTADGRNRKKKKKKTKKKTTIFRHLVREKGNIYPQPCPGLRNLVKISPIQLTYIQKEKKKKKKKKSAEDEKLSDS